MGPVAVDNFVNSLLEVEGELREEDAVQNDSERENVGLASAVGRLEEDIRRHIVEGTAPPLAQLAAVGNRLAEAKVDQLDLSSLGNDDVLQLDVVVDDSLLVAVDERVEELLEHSLGLLLFERVPISLNHVLQEVFSLDQFQDEVGIESLGKGIDHLDDVRVSELLSSVDFVSNQFLAHSKHGYLLYHHLLAFLVGGQVDLAELCGGDTFFQLVLVELGGCGGTGAVGKMIILFVKNFNGRCAILSSVVVVVGK